MKNWVLTGSLPSWKVKNGQKQEGTNEKRKQDGLPDGA
jgi:hypothetical protein